MSPKLFNTVLEYAFKTLEQHNKGIKIDGEYLNNLRFADDIVVTADDLGKAREMIMELQVAIEKVDINMHTDKTKMMTQFLAKVSSLNRKKQKQLKDICILVMKSKLAETIKHAKCREEYLQNGLHMENSEKYLKANYRSV